jgi:hypothetical protein
MSAAYFTDAGGNPNADSIARWDGSAWQALGNGLNNTVYAVAVSGSDVYVGGAFTDAGGNPNADRIARWDGSAWQALGSGLNSWVSAIAVSGTNVYVGGAFTDAGGNPNADRIARWDGSAWQALGSGLNKFGLRHRRQRDGRVRRRLLHRCRRQRERRLHSTRSPLAREGVPAADHAVGACCSTLDATRAVRTRRVP